MTYIAKLLAPVLLFSAITSSPAQASEDGWVEISMCGGQIILGPIYLTSQIPVDYLG